MLVQGGPNLILPKVYEPWGLALLLFKESTASHDHHSLNLATTSWVNLVDFPA